MNSIRRALKYTIITIAIIWAVFLVSLVTNIEQYGIVPRSMGGLLGIILSPFLHGGFGHIISNTIPLAVFSFVLFLFYEKIALPVILLSVLIGGGLVWLIAREANHIGASGLIYALAAFLITSGIIRKNIVTLAISVILIIIYGGLIWGVLPSDPRVSWEGHLFGAIAGVLLAFVFRKSTISYQKNKSIIPGL